MESKRPVALITGASRGLGRAIAISLAHAGYRIVVNYRTRTSDALATVQTIEAAGGIAVPCQADIRDAKAVASMISETAERWERFDVLVCNAAIAHDDLLLRISEESWETIVNTILSGSFHCLKSAGTVMTRQGHGCIILLGSLAALEGRSGQGPYAAAKAGLVGLMKSVAREWGSKQIRINMVLPGWHATELTGHAPDSTPPPFTPVLEHGTTMDAVGAFVVALAAMPDVSGQVFHLDSRILSH